MPAGLMVSEVIRHMLARRHNPAMPRILLIDDDEHLAAPLTTYFARFGCTLESAVRPSEGLAKLRAGQYDAAILDVMLPEMDGFELAELIRGSERTRHVPLVFVTADSRDPQRQFKGYESGAVDFLYKPIDPVILKNKSDVFFQLHRQKLQLASELKQRTETLRLNEMFMAVLGHDLRNPLSAIVMAPTWQDAYDSGIRPLMDQQMELPQAFDLASEPVKTFMLAQVDQGDLALFTRLSRLEAPTTAAELPLRVIVPSFMISELKKAFEIGFLLFI
eukprot:gene48973-65660_t